MNYIAVVNFKVNYQLMKLKMLFSFFLPMHLDLTTKQTKKGKERIKMQKRRTKKEPRGKRGGSRSISSA